MAKRALGKPPLYVAKRTFQELRSEADRFLGPRRARRFSSAELLARTRCGSVGDLWQRLADRPYVAAVERVEPTAYESLCPGDGARIMNGADRALRHQVDLLGSGNVDLGFDIDWHKDYKSGFRWAPRFCRDIDFRNPGRPSDVKFPWELSRVQWLIPCGQAFLLTGAEKWAEGARHLIEHWITNNPYAASVNWSCTMEAAMRILTWTWLFHAFARSAAWSDDDFRAKFLCSLYLHGDFTSRNVEYSDVNGNHCDADAAGLVFAGLFFGGDGEPNGWSERGWAILTDELPRQVSADGVDFEGSVPYHRLVTELFFLPGLYRQRCGLDVPAAYRDRLVKMGWFSEAYTRQDGIAPVWGDADDARSLPFGGQDINDHRYLFGWVGHSFNEVSLAHRLSGDLAECVWLLGVNAATVLAERHMSSSEPPPTTEVRSTLFRDGGYAILRNDQDHVFVDCGGVGLAGRGGHGHNDALSCEVVLCGCHIVADSGAYVYTADYIARNAFRSTAYHNTPRVDEREINRFMGPEDLWWLHDDAKPQILNFQRDIERDVLVVSHSGYRRLADPVLITRTYTLEHTSHRLTIEDRIDAQGSHFVEVPIHLPCDAVAELTSDGALIQSHGARFALAWSEPGDWACVIEASETSTRYGIRRPSTKLVWRRRGPVRPLSIQIAPMQSDASRSSDVCSLESCPE